MSGSAWISSQSETCRARAQELAAALDVRDVHTFHIKDGAVLGAGILVFEEVGRDLYERAWRLSRGGTQRVLGVAICEVRDPWELLASGVSDVLTWDVGDSVAARAALRLERWAKVDELVASPLVARRLVGRSPPWVAALRKFVEVAHFTDASVLITGDSGTGKELVARMIHSLDPRPEKGNFVVLDCTTVVPSLSGSEFFGHERGAFTGAVSRREGAFEKADGGTLFLDEVSELPPQLQAELLRVIQEGTYKPVGSDSWKKSHFRLVAATNKDLAQEEAGGRFRRDLYYRLSSWTSRLPNLRDRVDDVVMLAEHFVAQMTDAEVDLDPPVAEFLVQRAYPGNVRDLRQLVERIVARHVGPGPITVGDIPDDDRPSRDRAPSTWCDDAFKMCIRRGLAAGVGLKDIARAASDTAVDIAIAEEDGSLQRAARRLGVTDRALQMRRSAPKDDSYAHAT
ncbi:MAG TPA: sigma 54-interacting transcriptional regulator [Actinomycetota bacterium]|nr:sigma 54-interacting transcriptional regulator [Actinomycetota bacterium]